jgi:hypothetical protein
MGRLSVQSLTGLRSPKRHPQSYRTNIEIADREGQQDALQSRAAIDGSLPWPQGSGLRVGDVGDENLGCLSLVDDCVVQPRGLVGEVAQYK